ncbi:MAG: hypothetical protein GX886_14770, partial [Comamonadaceae bacterium]|nr:hypothetical protein [Comamonadaceae bacterium]
MSIRHLDDLFDPASVAVIGASTRPGSVGATVWRNLRQGRYAGPRWAVNLRHRQVDGERAYALARAGEEMDLAARKLWVESLEILARPDADTVELEMVCGKGGYVRSIAR